jgi:hypothetical protein
MNEHETTAFVRPGVYSFSTSGKSYRLEVTGLSGYHRKPRWLVASVNERGVPSRPVGDTATFEEAQDLARTDARKE